MAKKGINLLPQEEFEASILGRILKWATGTFRIIVIITEIIVMGAFLSRFWLDAQNSDLTDSITVKTAQIESQADFENSFRNLQKKLNIIKSIDNDPKSSDRISLISSKVPQEIILSGITTNDKGAEIKGTSASELAIAQFITNLSAEKTFKSVDLASLSTSQTNPGQNDFTLNINY